MLIEEGKVYILSGNQDLTNTARTFFDSNLKDSPQKTLSDSLKNSESYEMAGLLFYNGMIFVAAKGGSSVKIIRNNMRVTLLQSVGNSVITASGFPKEGDRMILTLGEIDGKILELDFNSEHSLRINIPTTDFNQKVIQKSDMVKSFLNKIISLLPKKSIYIKPEFTEEISPQSKKLTFSIAIILLALLGVSIGFGIRQKRINDTKGKYKAVLSQAQDEIDQAISLASVSPEKSRQLFIDSQQKIAQMDSLKVKDSVLDELKKKINESRASILGEYLINPEMFLDLTLLSSGFTGDTLAYSDGQIYVMDTNGKRIVSVNVGTKKSKVVAGPSVIGSASALACYEDRVFVLEADGIYEVDSGNTKVVNKTWSGDALIAAFAGNLYVIDKSGNQIYRYAGINNTFGEKQNWLAAGTNVNFGSVSQMTIDGLIYALYPNSKVLKFSQGSPLNFNISGVIPEIGNINAIYANPDNQNIYLLDKAGKRIVVTDKKGVYKAQYANDLVANAINLVVSEKDGKIILLTGDKLYSIDIKN